MTPERLGEPFLELADPVRVRLIALATDSSHQEARTRLWRHAESYPLPPLRILQAASFNSATGRCGLPP